MTEFNNPHLKWPFKWGTNGSAECVEQNSPDDVTQCIFALFNTPIGFRLEIPEFGVHFGVLEENGPSITQLEAAALEWEPRASYLLTEQEFQEALSTYIKVGERNV